MLDDGMTMAETFTCDSCRGTFDKGWSDAEATAEAEELFPGIDVTDPSVAGIVCVGCFEYIMARARAEAPKMIGEGWREQAREPITDFPGFVASVLADGYTLNPCRDHCQDKAAEHVHLHSPWGGDGIVWADGRVSEWDLTQPARLIYPAAGRGRPPSSSLPGRCYRTDSGMAVHVKPGCRCK